MRKTILSLFFIMMSAIACVAQFKPAGAIYVEAPFELKIGKAGKGVSLRSATWLKEKKENGITATMATTFNWKEMKFSFVPTQDGEVKITFRSRFHRFENGEVSKNRTFFDDVHINDKGFYNSGFGDRLKNWKKLGKPEIVYDIMRGGVAATSYNHAIFRMIKVKAGEPVEISVVAKDGGLRLDQMYVDFSPFANLAYDGNGFEDGEFIPLTNFTKRVVKNGIFEFEGLKFKLAEGITAFSSPRAANQKNISIDYNTNSNFFGFLYILHSTGKNIRQKNKHKNCGTIEVIYADGRVDRFWIKSTYEAMSTFKKEVGDNGVPAYVEDEKKGRGVVYLSRYPLEKKPIRKINFIGTGYSAWNVVGVTLANKDVKTTVYKKPDPKEWGAVDVSDLKIAEGSALDVSAGMGHKPAGKYGRLRIDEKGKFYFEGNPSERIKFKGTNWRPGDHFFNKIKTKEDIDVLAKIARRQGYNMVRWRISMRQEKEFLAPYQMRPEVLDMYDYFMYAMAREGVYTHLNLSSHDLGDPDFKWSDRYDVKVKMILGDPATREAWKKLVQMQLNHVNPYSGKKWKDDPAVATTEYYNEMELGFLAGDRNLSSKVAKFANGKFQDWLKKKYATIEDLNMAWQARGEKFTFKKFEDVNAFGDRRFRTNRDKTSFILESGKEFLAFCKNVVRDIEKFDAPLHQFNCGRTLEVIYMSAEGGSYMAQNVYFVHPTEFNSLDSRTAQNSSLEPNEALMYFRAAVTKKMADRPMALTEWQHCHWNPYKHEAGVVFPAYSALHDFDNLTVHDVAIEKEGKGIFGHAEVAKSPIMRANEFLSYCFFFRGDVKPSPNRVEVVFDKNYVAKSRGMSYIVNSDQSKLSLLTGFSIDFPSAKKFAELKKVKVKPADISLAPAGYTTSRAYNNYVEAGETKGEKFDFAKGVELLREKKILSSENITDPAKEIYQSDTGEITLRLNERLAKVITPKSEAVSIKPETKNEKLGKLVVKSTSVAGTVAVVSVDGDKTLANSKRMVFIYSTDTTSTDFTTSISGEYLKFRGRQPIIVQYGKLSAELELPKDNAQNYKLYALALTGKRLEEIPTKIEDGKMYINLDTSKLKKEPSVFYEIVAE